MSITHSFKRFGAFHAVYAEFLSVKSVGGAVGDGVTDDWAKINAFIANVCAHRSISLLILDHYKERGMWNPL